MRFIPLIGIDIFPILERDFTVKQAHRFKLDGTIPYVLMKHRRPQTSEGATPLSSSPFSVPRPRALLPPPPPRFFRPSSLSPSRIRPRRSCTSLDTTTRCAGCAGREGGSSPRRSSTSTASSWRLKTRRGPPPRRHFRAPGRRTRCASLCWLG